MTKAEITKQLKRRGIPQRELAKELGVPAPKLSRWLSGAVDTMRDLSSAQVSQAVEVLVAKRGAQPIAPTASMTEEDAGEAVLPESATEPADAVFARAAPAAARVLAAAAASGDLRAATFISEAVAGKARQRAALEKKHEDPLEKDAFLEELLLVEERLVDERDGTVVDGAGI